MADGAANPLVAGREDSTEWYTGIGLAEGIADLSGAFSGGGWIDGLIGGFGTGLETLSLVVDPLGTLVSWGVAWLLEHVKPLSDALDWLAGDPDQVAAYAKTWRNVADATRGAVADYTGALGGPVAGWSGPAASAYRGHADGHRGLLTALADGAGLMAVMTEGAGLIVALVRELVRDLIADFVSLLAVRLPTWTAEVGLSFGLATPWVVSQVVALVSRWVNKIGTLLRALTRTMRKLDSDFIKTLAGKIDDITAGLDRLSSPANPGFTPGPGGPGVRPLASDIPNLPNGPGAGKPGDGGGAGDPGGVTLAGSNSPTGSSAGTPTPSGPDPAAPTGGAGTPSGPTLAGGGGTPGGPGGPGGPPGPGGPAASGGAGGGDVTRPGGPLGGSPTGRPTTVGARQDPDVRRSLERENDGAVILAENGYRTMQNPTPEQVAAARAATGDVGTVRSRPDYLIEGRVYDCYSPAETKPVRGVWSEVRDKIQDEQTQRVVVNLQDWGGDLDALRRQFADWPIENLKELKVITANRDVVHLLP